MSLNPGAKYWGISVFSRAGIISSFVKNLSTNDSSRNRLAQVRKTFLNLSRKFHPHILILERPKPSWKDLSPYLGKIIQEIKRLSKTAQIRVIEITPEELRKALCGNPRATKEKIAQTLAESHPELKEYLTEDRIRTGEYWSRMVTSMALGICYLRSK